MACRRGGAELDLERRRGMGGEEDEEEAVESGESKQPAISLLTSSLQLIPRYMYNRLFQRAWIRAQSAATMIQSGRMQQDK